MKSPTDNHPFLGELSYNNILIEVTGRCMLQCAYCYNSSFNQTSAVQSELTVLEIKHILVEAQSLGYRNISFSGGEPFLKNGFFSLLDACKDVNVTIFTSASVLGDSWIRKVIESPQIKQLRVSLDGLSANDQVRVGSNWKIILKNIEAIKKYRHIRVDFNTMLTSVNIKTLIDFYRVLKDVQPTRWNLDIPVFTGRAAEESKRKMLDLDFQTLGEQLMELIKIYLVDNQPFRLSIRGVYDSYLLHEMFTPYEKGNSFSELLYPPDVHPCIYERVTVIRPNGDITRCPSHNVVLANIRNFSSLQEAIKASQNHPYQLLKVKDIHQCSNCRYIGFCGTGCRANARYLMGTDKNKDPVACALATIAEKYIWPHLPLSQQLVYLKLINPEGKRPHIYESLLSCVSDKEGIQ